MCLKENSWPDSVLWELWMSVLLSLEEDLPRWNWRPSSAVLLFPHRIGKNEKQILKGIGIVRWLFYKWNRCTDVFKKERNTAVLREVRHKRKERPTKRGWASIIWWCHPCLWHSCFKNQHPLSDIVRLWNLRSIYI